MGSLVRKSQRGGGASSLAGSLLAFWLLGGTPLHAEEPPKGTEPQAPHVDLDALLKLPDSMQYEVERKGGATRGEWRERFVSLRTDLATERKGLEAARAELEKAANSADAWKFSPAGVGDVSDSPVDYQLREKIRRGEAEVSRLERDLRELEVEANLAGVPEDWRK